MSSQRPPRGVAGRLLRAGVPWLQSPRLRVTAVVTKQSSSFLQHSGAGGQGQGRSPSWGLRVCPRPVLGMEQEGDDH